MSFQDKVKNRESGIVVYGITPPKAGTDEEKIQEIASKQIARLSGLDLDGLILYDIQDEESRTSVERPFPFMETLDGLEYSNTQLADLDIAKIIYRSVGKYSEAELNSFLSDTSMQSNATVFVGAASKDQAVTLNMNEAYALKQTVNADMLIGGVTIPERHLSKGDEHIRVFDKMAQGCNFFVSQGVYDVNATKSFLSDYYYYGKENNLELVPILLTLTPCGSPKTLEFMKWLGISIPRWLENELIHSQDILQQSVDVCVQSWKEIQAFANEKNIPLGCNIESVATRKVEIDASIDLYHRIMETL